MTYRIAVVGATGAVGSEILNILDERDFPTSDVAALASKNSAGKEVSFGERGELKVEALEDFVFDGVDIALFSPGASVSARFAPKAAADGCIVIDNTSHFRMEPDVPLIVPEVNADALGAYRERGIIANPNCSTIQMVVALKPLHDIARIKRVVVSTYQSVSGGGTEAMDELFEHTKAIYMNDKKNPEIFKKPIPFNVIPQIDVPVADGLYKEEWKMVVETQKILDPGIQVVPTCVRVPVFVGHAEAVNVEFHDPISLAEAREALMEAEGIVVLDDHDAYEFVTPIECVGEFAVFVSRLRGDPTVDYGLSFWCVSDNLRKGAALNAVQIAETLVQEGYL